MSGQRVERLLLKLKANDIHISLVDDRLRVSAPEQGISDDLHAELNACKQDIIDFLKAAKPDTASSVPELVASNDKSPAPLSFGQQRSWLVHELNKEQASPYDTLNIVLRIGGLLNVDALGRSLAEIVRRHEVLRTIFVLKDKQPVQVVEKAELVLEQEDIAHLSTDERETRLVEYLQETRDKMFDLATGPLFRAKLVRMCETEHVLMMMVHHIAFDDWSKGILLRELSLLYQSFCKGLPSPLPELPVQYRDFAVWQRNWLQGEVLQKHLTYWTEQLADLSILELPTDYPRPPLQTFNGASETLLLPRNLSAALPAMSKQRGVTLYMTMLSVLGILLSRYSGQGDIAIGTPIANRDRKEVQDLIGFFLNMLVMRLDLSGEPAFVELLEQVKQTALTGYAHQHLPFEKLVEEMQLERNTSHTPLFQITFTLLDAQEATPAQNKDLEQSSMLDIGRTTRFDLEVYVREEAAGLVLSITYNTDLFAADTIKRMLAHYQQLLTKVVANPEQPVSAIPMLQQEERQQIVHDWNQTQTAYPRDSSIHELFQQQLALHSDDVAVVCGEDSLTYGELNGRANRLGHFLQGHGVGSEVLVGLFMERSLDMVVAILGILKAGGAYVPLDPEYPSQRLAFMLEDSMAPVLLTQSSLRDRLPSYLGRVISLDEDWDEINLQQDTNLSSDTSARDLAYVIYTSGSTGRPKGTCVEHRSVLRLVKSTNYLEFDKDEVLLQMAPISFDASTLELWGSMLNGAKLVIFRPGPVSLPEISEAIDRYGISILWLTSALFNQMVDQHMGSLLRVRQLLAGGEALSPAHVKRILSEMPAEHRLVNGYGPTENTTFTCCHVMTRDSEIGRNVPIGRPISNTRVYVLDARAAPVPIGVPGELYVGGDGLARGYLNRPELTAEKFISTPFADRPGERLYRTGDKVRYLADGSIEFLGRFDHQVKIRGYRIELGEVEAVLGGNDEVRIAVAMMREDIPGDKRLVVYLVLHENRESSAARIKEFARQQLPGYMLPSAYILLDEFPLSPNGKLDREALPAPDYESLGTESYIAPRSDVEIQIAEIWCDLLGIDKAGTRDNFFDLGGHSLLLSQIQARLNEAFERKISMLDLFQYPTIESLAIHLVGEDGQTAGFTRARERMDKRRGNADDDNAIAIIAMSGRFPGAASIEQFWQNVASGVESIRFFSDEELAAAGVPEQLVADSRFVPAKGFLDDAELFDASFFGYSPREAEIIDPQQRLFLECAWEALERAGYDPQRYQGLIGVYAGASTSSYQNNLFSHPEIVNAHGGLQIIISNDKDFLPTRISYKLNLRGPSVNIQTACSTSLVAIHDACKGLRDHDCDIALAGGISVNSTRVEGYFYQQESILSPDGHCRAFSADARGTVGGEGVGIVALKRLSEARRDGDVITAVIRGTAINNDGSSKVGFTAPSVDGQAEVIALAQAAAGLTPDDISYIEAHGTGTKLGDPIEMAALTRVFEESTRDRGNSCAIGAIKTNVGHLDAAAGVTGIIKTALALKHRQIPPSLNYSAPNPEIDFEHSPFHVNTELVPWEGDGVHPRRAGVSSFGMGGTNAHAVLEEAPPREESEPGRAWQLLPVSAKNEDALAAYADRIADYLERHGDANLADVSYTLRTGRGQFEYRCAAVGNDNETGADDLRLEKGAWTICDVTRSPPVVFMFPGQGSQHARMGQGLYETEALFREIVDDCCEQLQPHIGLDLRELMFMQAADDPDRADEQLRQTLVAQCSLFVIEYALARLWMSWGIEPAAMIGHSIGEYVAACISGVIELDEALLLIASRGQAMARAPAGAMIAVPLAEERVIPYLQDDLWLSVINGHSSCVVSGTAVAIDDLEQRLKTDGVETTRLHTSGAFHSGLMDEVVPRLVEVAGRLSIGAVKIPYISNVTGSWIEESQVRKPEYWGQHLRNTVRFADGIDVLLEKYEHGIFLEAGPGNSLTSMVRQSVSEKQLEVGLLASLRHPREDLADGETLTRALAGLWQRGVEIDWALYDRHSRRCKLELPTYPFQRQSYWVEPSAKAAGLAQESQQRTTARKIEDTDQWCYLPVWKSSQMIDVAVRNDEDFAGRWLIFMDQFGLGEQLAQSIDELGGDVIRVAMGAEFKLVAPALYQVNPGSKQDFQALFEVPEVNEIEPGRIIHAWNLGHGRTPGLDTALNSGYYSVLYLIQSIAQRWPNPGMHIDVITDGVQSVTGNENLVPENSLVLGLGKVLGIEYPLASLRNIDIELPAKVNQLEQYVVSGLLGEMASINSGQIAFRSGSRWIMGYERADPGNLAAAPRLRDEGVYLITGGVGGVGLVFAAHLAKAVRARLILTARSELPAESSWDAWLSTHEDDDKTAQKILKIRALQEMGAEVMIAAVDTADRDGMQKLIQSAKQRFGDIHGVIHAAGVVSGPSMDLLQNLDREKCELQFHPKVRGLLLLKELFDGDSLDFIMPISSVSTVLGGMTFAAYAAANQFMDALSQQQFRAGNRNWISVDWDGWNFEKQDLPTAIEGTAASFAMTAEEGNAVFDRTLRMGNLPRVIVSTGDLQWRIEQLIGHQDQLSRSGPDTGSSIETAKVYQRPRLKSAYVEPSTETEQTICEMWQELLGISGVGIDDDFFELGGHSLLAIQIIARLRTEFDLELSLESIFETRTVRLLAAFVENQSVSVGSADQVAQLAQKIKLMTPEKREQMLAQARRKKA